ncbi:hypothetical protein GVY41_01285 [Frigidibacter albus]|uniref:DUF6603 domain-containing protein n=1 Tax=Frigidibacter albus TaxID=1465486 RepID=A0A6L8VDH1_9RHOB|nr:DUF6603 domain-containing protein [Frigidibacter albus]MZQ87726.1 hypothetical protein [Frigidibacter albus]NBE29632.1 hypothetical protein [Frigidibacter albus]GGH43673.1 hypothetical protein GCM10011341_02510 [Frigidibacter albus]
MNAFAPGDFGEMSGLLRALGLVTAAGEFNSDWIANPDDYLKDMLAEDGQRQALLNFVATLREGQIERDAENRQWIELFSEPLAPGSAIVFFLVVDDAPQDEVRLSLGVRFATSAPLAVSASSLLFPLFRAGKKGRPATPSPELMGRPGGRIVMTSEVTIADAPAAPGEAGLQAVGVLLSVPTALGDGDPQIGLTLRGLQLPGEAAGRDLVLSLSDPEAVADAGIELILGLLQAQIGTAAGAQIRAFAKLLGLAGDPNIPAFPIADVVERGAAALGDWMAQALGDAPRRTAWLQALAELLANGAAASPSGVTLPVGAAQVRIGLAAVPGAGGRPVVTLSLSFGFSQGAAEVGITADLVRIDLGTRAAVAVPSLRAEARFDLSALAMPNVAADAMLIGFGLDAGRRPLLVIALENAVVFGTTHARLDLTNPDALAAAAAQAATDALAEVLNTLGPAADRIAVALGWRAPPGAGAGYPRVDLIAFLGDPLGALRAHWDDVMSNHAADVTAVLAQLRELLTGDATPGSVTGSGTSASPWLLPLVAGLHVAVWRGADGRLTLGLGFVRSVDTLGQRCTVIETRVRAAIVAIDLASGGASFLPEVLVQALGRARGGGRLVTDQGAVRVEVDHLGITALWTPDGGFGIRLSAPNPAVVFDNVPLPLPVPDLSLPFDEILASLGNREWEALERLAAIVATKLQSRWLDDLVEALGWRPAAPMLGGPRRHRLALSALVDDAGMAIREWLADLIGDPEAEVARRLQPLARFLSGRPNASFVVEGRGTITEPWRIDLLPGSGLPALAAWREPDAPLPVPQTLHSMGLRGWRPGATGLGPGELAQAILSEMPDVGGPFGAGLTAEALHQGLMAVAALWQGTDGLVPPPAAAPAGTVLHLVQNRSAAGLIAGLDLAVLLGAAPAMVVQVTVLAAGAAVDAAIDPARMLDMREAGRDPGAFTPLAGPGTWHVLLAPRADAKLASGDPDGTRGQVARLKTVLQDLAGATVIADAAAGHAAWLALHEMGSGNNRLVTVGLPLSALPPPAAATAEMLRRLGEFLPGPDPAEPDDADLATARRLLSMRLGASAFDLAGLALPSGWTGARRADLEVHLVHGVIDRDTVNRALTATVAAGLSLHAQVRARKRPSRQITSASLGLYLPLRNAPAPGGLAVEGQALAELLGCDIDSTGRFPLPRARAARRIAAGFEIRRQGGWLIGGPGAAVRALPLELRSIDVAVRLSLGGTEPGLDRCEVTLHGVRIHGRAFPRLVLSPGLPDAGLGIDGLAAPTTPEIRQLISVVMQDLEASADVTLGRIREALKAVGVLDAAGGFDGLSLSNWLDDPAARLQEALADAALRQRLLDLIAGFAADHAGLSFDAGSRSLTVALSGSTGEPVFGDWALAATLRPAGASGGSLRLGAAGGLQLAATLAPFALTLRLPAGLAQGLDLPEALPIWPAPNFELLARPVLPALAAFALSRIIEGLRGSDPAVQPVIDAALTAFGLLKTVAGSQVTAVPPQVFIDPGAWIKTALGSSTAVTSARVIAALDGLRPLVNLPGAPGVWDLAPGISLRARSQAGTVLEITLDPALFLPAADVALGGAFGLRFGTDGSVQPALDLFVGLKGGAAGTRAVHLTVAGSDVALVLRPAAGGDIGIYPEVGGLTQLAAAGVVAALPEALDAIVATGTDAGNLLGDIGDALQLRQGGAFDAAQLTAWATDPASTLQARWPQLLAGGLARLGPALPAGVAVTTPAGGVRLQVNNAGTPGSVIAIGFLANPVAVEVSATIAAIPFVRSVAATLRFDATGLTLLQATVGPAEIPLVDAIVLRPVVRLDIGSAAADPFISVGLATDAANTNALALRYDFDTESFDLGFGGNSPEEIAAGIMRFAIDLIGSFVMDLGPVVEILDLDVGSSDVRAVLEGVVLVPGAGLDPEFFRVLPNPGETPQQFFDTKLQRALKLLDNIAAAAPSVSIGGELNISLAKSGNSIGLALTLAQRLEIVGGDIAVWLENDSRWIIGGPPAGIAIGLLRVQGATIGFEPSLSVNGLGIRVGRSNAPLLATPLSLGSIALHIFARIGAGEMLGGAQVQLAEIGAAVGGASGGNPIAQGMLAETNSGDAALAPAFSPAFSVQTRPAAQGGGIAFGFSAGEGGGPWWLPIRKQFGPLYIAQVGLGTQVSNDTLQSISLLFDGGVSIAGLSAAVDDLELRYNLDQGGIFDPASWSVDLAGLAVSADLSGVTLAGGLRKFGENPDVEYVGMLVARVATYGLSLYGGYASIQTGPQGPFTAFFAFGAVTGPIGGPPAFFLTGIGGGFGINRDVVPPTDMSKFDEFVMIAALDPSFDPPGDLMAYMEEVRNTFPALKDRFWFAAGISFNSFALVDGVAVVCIEFGQGFELSIFGLARMALPRPEVALVSIELGLMARFSTEEGVIWIQAQLTDNSWLLHKSARLTGGFAFVSWFKGPLAGQFVLSLGGFHPSFRRDGYPVVPRLGFNWSVASNIVIKAETYFALSSEAIMAGGLFEASAKFGPAFANLSFGGNAIVYFDPFRYMADAHARVSAGIRIKTFLGTVRLSYTLGAFIEVAGPQFHGKARIEVGPIDITVRFGNSANVPAVYISWTDFAAKYLELAPGNRAQALSGMAGKGALPPASATGTEPGTADGSAAHPFDVSSEFELSFTTTIPVTRIDRAGTITPTPAGKQLGLAPVNRVIHNSTLHLSLKKDGVGAERLGDTLKIVMKPRRTGAFPVGVWGPAQNPDVRTVPKGDIITATEGVDFVFKPQLIGKIPAPATGGVAFNQVEAGPRKPLPLRNAGALRARLVSEAVALRAVLSGLDAARMPQFTADWRAAGRSDTAVRSWARERAVPMRVGLLSERIVGTAAAGGKKPVVVRPRPVPGAVFGTLKVRGVMMQAMRATPGLTVAAQTTVKGALSEKVKRMVPPTMADALAGRETRFATALLRAEIAEPLAKTTLIARAVLPETVAARTAVSAGAGKAAAADRAVLAGIAAMVTAPRGRRRVRGAAPARALSAGEIAVFDLPAASPRFESSGVLQITGTARLIAIGLDGRIALNQFPAKDMTELPSALSAFALIAGAEPGAELAGWVEGSRLAYLDRSVSRCLGGFVTAEGASRSRGGRAAASGWIQAGTLTDQSALVVTRFDAPATSLALVLEGTLTDTDLENLAIAFDGAEEAGARPTLLPFDGKTLIVYALKAGAGFSVSVGGQTPGTLDGVVAARLPADRLASRMVAEAVRLDLEAVADPRSGTVTASWQAPADLNPVE